MHLQVPRDSWHMKIYLWWYNHKYNRGHSEYKTSTNLCPYMRAVMFWAPLRLFFWDWVKIVEWKTQEGTDQENSWFVSTNMLTIPALMVAIAVLSGDLSYGLKVVSYWVVGVAMALFLACCLALYLTVKIEMYKRAHRTVPAPPRPPTEFDENLVKTWKNTVQFFQLVGELLKAGHDRICPEIIIADVPVKAPPPQLPPGSSSYDIEI